LIEGWYEAHEHKDGERLVYSCRIEACCIEELKRLARALVQPGHRKVGLWVKGKRVPLRG
jgi:hypothetical protein